MRRTPSPVKCSAIVRFVGKDRLMTIVEFGVGDGGVYLRLARSLRMLEEFQVESCEHQDDADIDYQPFPDQVSEER